MAAERCLRCDSICLILVAKEHMSRIASVSVVLPHSEVRETDNAGEFCTVFLVNRGLCRET
jgi:hypothetical protein